MSIYQNVKKVCSKNGITINALESKLNFPRGSIFKWDKHTPSVEKLKKLADYFNVPIEYFLE